MEICFPKPLSASSSHTGFFYVILRLFYLSFSIFCMAFRCFAVVFNSVESQAKNNGKRMLKEQLSKTKERHNKAQLPGKIGEVS